MTEGVCTTFKLRLKVLIEFFRRLRRKSPPDIWQFGLAVREVIIARVLRAMTCQLSLAEARRMVEEKQWTAVRAQLAYKEALLNGEPASVLGVYFDVYHRVVESNCKRLRNRRRRWPWSLRSESN